MKEAPVLIFVMNDLGCRLDHTLSWDERVSGICYAPSIDAAVENGCLTADSPVSYTHLTLPTNSLV